MNKRLSYLGLALALCMSGCSSSDSDVFWGTSSSYWFPLSSPDGLRISTQPSKGTPNTVLSKLQTEFLRNNQLLPYQGSVSLNLSTNPTGATLGGSLNGNSQPNGQMDFNDLTISKKGIYQISASSPNLPTVVSDPITIGGGPVTIVKYTNIDIAGVSMIQMIKSADLNNDGNLDLVITHFNDNKVTSLLGDGNGNFGSPVSMDTSGPGTKPLDLVLRDFNRDGKIDLAFAAANGYNLLVALGNGDGSFAAPTAYPATRATSIVAGDFNGDGFEDLAVSRQLTDKISIFLGDGNGSFAAPTELTGSTGQGFWYSSAADFNQDGKLDIASPNGFGQGIDIFYGNGDGSFSTATNIPTGKTTQAVCTADLNNDGLPDVAVTHYDTPGTLSVFFSTGSGFSSATTLSVGKNPFLIEAADFNLDGNMDLLCTNRDDDTVSVLLGNGDGSFQPANNIATSASSPFSLNVADYNKDSVPDFTVSLQNSHSLDVFLQTP